MRLASKDVFAYRGGFEQETRREHAFNDGPHCGRRRHSRHAVDAERGRRRRQPPGALRALACRSTWPALRRLRGAVAVVGGRPRHLLAQHLGPLRGAGRRLPRTGAREPRDARRALVPERAAELHGARVPAGQCAAARAGGAHRRRRGARGLVGRTAPDDRGVRGHAAATRRAAGRPRRVLPAEPGRDRGRLPGLRQPGRDLVQLRTRHGPLGGVRPPQPDRTQGAAGHRQLPLQRQGARPP